MMEWVWLLLSLIYRVCVGALGISWTLEWEILPGVEWLIV